MLLKNIISNKILIKITPDKIVKKILNSFSEERLGEIINEASDKKLERIIDNVPRKNLPKIFKFLSEEKIKQIINLHLGEEFLQGLNQEKKEALNKDGHIHYFEMYMLMKQAQSINKVSKEDLTKIIKTISSEDLPKILVMANEIKIKEDNKSFKYNSYGDSGADSDDENFYSELSDETISNEYNSHDDFGADLYYENSYSELSGEILVTAL